MQLKILFEKLQHRKISKTCTDLLLQVFQGEKGMYTKFQNDNMKINTNSKKKNNLLQAMSSIGKKKKN